jgi:bromodomain-containing protein 7/9
MDPQSDFRLVTGNAKIFNPPGTIYHAEAERIEAFGLDHISKAAATVIEYETDWNIEIEQDVENSVLNLDEYDGDAPTPMDVDGSLAAASPAPSASQAQPLKRGARGPYKKTIGNPTTDNIDTDGRLPGSKDGLGAFPPGSDWAKLMLALKRKGKQGDHTHSSVPDLLICRQTIPHKERETKN